jgi:hypothetical protein
MSLPAEAHAQPQEIGNRVAKANGELPDQRDKGRTHIDCPKCRTTVVWLSKLTRLEVSTFGLELREAKALAFHITRSQGVCHRCTAQVIGSEPVCSKCRSANLDW